MRIDTIGVANFQRIDESSLQPNLALPIPQGISTDSSISSAAPVDKLYPALSRPFLPTPQSHYMYRLIEIEREMTRLVEIEGKYFDREIRDDLNRIETLNREKTEMLRLHAKELKSKVKWSAWQTVTQYITSATSIAVGIGCFGSGAASTAGAFLIASGVLGLTNQVASDTGAWRCMASLMSAERDKQIKIAAQVNFGLSAFSIALCLGGTIGAYNARALELLALHGRDPIMQQAATVLTTLNSGLQVSMKVGGALTEKRLSVVKADLKVIDLSSYLLREGIKTNTTEITKMIQLSEEIDKMIKNAISSSTM